MSLRLFAPSSWPYYANHRPGIHPDSSDSTGHVALLQPLPFCCFQYSEFKKKERMDLFFSLLRHAFSPSAIKIRGFAANLPKVSVNGVIWQSNNDTDASTHTLHIALGFLLDLIPCFWPIFEDFQNEAASL